MDWNVMVQYLPQYEKAAWLTLRLGVAGIFWAILVGLVCAVLQYEKVPVLRRIVGAYIQLSRNTPLLVQLFFLYYGLPKIGIKTNAELCGIAGLAFLGGSYMAEAFRSGLEAIEPIQTESALSLGMSRLQTMRYVVLPQAVSISMPAFMANIIFLLKETSVFSAISLMDLMFTAKDLIGLYYKTAENLFLLPKPYQSSCPEVGVRTNRDFSECITSAAIINFFIAFRLAESVMVASIRLAGLDMR